MKRCKSTTEDSEVPKSVIGSKTINNDTIVG